MRCQRKGIDCRGKQPMGADQPSGSRRHAHPFSPPQRGRSVNENRRSSPSESSVPERSNNDALTSLTDAFARSRLPLAELSIFDGNPLDFVGWQSDMEAMFSSARLSSFEKLRLLLKYLTGPPREAIKGLALVEAECSFDRAQQILKERFGNPICVAEAFRNRLERWPNLTGSDPGEFRRFGDFLTQCCFAQEWLPSLDVLNDPHLIFSLARKLPCPLKR